MIDQSALYLACAGLFLIAAGLVFLRLHQKKKNIVALGLYFCSVLFINYASLSAGRNPLSGWNEFFTGIISTLQSFSLDANYTEIVNNLQGGVTDNSLILVMVFAVLVLAPILGGAVLLAVIADLFPELKFWLHSHIARKLYLFSFLNEQSLNMAKELLKEGKRGEACVAFANAWAEEGNEDESNLVSRAVELGAICLKKDLSVLKLPANREAVYFFARDDELRNLDEAIRMAGEAQTAWRNCKRVVMYVYAQNDAAPQVMEQIHAQLEGQEKQRLQVNIVPCKTNTVYRLLYREPLYQCLSADPSVEEHLDIAIVGSDAWAEELFRALFWCGQIPRKQLRLFCISEDAKDFEQRIRFLIPELDCQDNGLAYCETRFLPCRADTAELEKLFLDEGLGQIKLWYICLGESRKNLEIASHLKSRLSALQLRNPQTTLICYQMDSDHLKETLNRAEKRNSLYRMHAFASRLEEYALDNIRGSFHEYASTLDRIWTEKSGAPSAENEYRRRSSLASALHLPYRLYAFGLLSADLPTTEAVRQGLESFRSRVGFQREHEYAIGWMEHRRWNAYTRSLGYRKVSLADWVAYYETEEGQQRREKDQKIQTKDEARKLHTCLTEYRSEPAFPEQLLCRLGEDWGESELVAQLMQEGKLDELDMLSVTIYRMSEGLKKRGGDIKSWDTETIQDAAKLEF